MKKFLIIFLMMLFVVNIYAQNNIDPPPIDSVVNSSLINRNFNRFIKGWNWGSVGEELDKALGINFYHGYPIASADVADSMNVSLVLGAPIIGNGRNANQYFVALGLQLEPTIEVDSSEAFKPRYGDKCGSVFGFNYRDFIVGDTNTDFERFVLHKNNLTQPKVVLKDIWDGTVLRWLDYYPIRQIKKKNDGTFDTTYTERTNSVTENDAHDTTVFHPFNGKQYCLSINLKAMHTDSVAAHLNDTILVLRMPYILYDKDNDDTTHGYVKFDKVPMQSVSGNDSIIGSLGDYRGVARDWAITAGTTEIVITGEMLENNLTNDTSITLSAFARFTGDIDSLTNEYDNNPYFRYDWHENRYGINKYITKVDVEVEYYGNLDVGINWVRIETPRLQKLMRGGYDTDVRNRIDELFLDYWTAYSRAQNPRHPRIAMFYAMDEMTMCQWTAGRYFNMLVDTLADVELAARDNKPAQFRHATSIKSFKNGDNLVFKTFVAVPYVKKTNGGKHPETFNYNYGYKGNEYRVFTHIFDSEYETFLEGHYTTLPINDRNIFEYNDWEDPLYNYRHSTMFQVEDNLYNFYYKNNGLLFNDFDNNWVANLWVQSEAWIIDDAINSFVLPVQHSRPKTGEELRLMMNEATLLGAKGLVYWLKRGGYHNLIKDEDYNSYCQDCSATLGFQNKYFNYGNLTGKDLIYSPTIGGDFVQSIGDPNTVDPNGFDTVYSSNAYLYSMLGIDSTRIYIGLQSMRAEVYKMHKWIDEYEDLLMRLRLIGWYGKGFIDWIAQHPSYPTETIDKYVKVGKNVILTRPVGRTKAIYQPDGELFGHIPYYEQSSSIDSGFYDVMLHFEYDENGNKVDSVFYIGVQNRRTDPLIRNGTDSTLDFYSTAEFDKNVVLGGNDLSGTYRNAAWWRERWWKRQGSREIALTLNLPSEYRNKLVRVTELGLNRDTLKAIHKFNGNTLSDSALAILYPRYKRIIGTNSNIITNYLPGEGKLFKCEFIDEDDDLSGNLANSNQCKMVAYPVLDTSGNETGLIQYHLVYFKTDTSDNDRVKVYYSRSEPLDSASTLEEIDPVHYSGDTRYPQNIIWQRFTNMQKGIAISDNYTDLSEQTKNSDECDYPAIVVRKDSNDNKLKAYIIYTCKDGADAAGADVVVSCLDATNPYNDPNEISNRQIDDIQTPADSANQVNPVRSQWGTPVVNASANGLYYAWTSGEKSNPLEDPYVMIAFAPPDSGIPTTMKKIQNLMFNYNSGIITGHKQKFPSLNTYSDITLGEEHCSLVWSCDFPDMYSTSGQYRIMYTNVKLDYNGNIFDTIPDITNLDYTILYPDVYHHVGYFNISFDNFYPVISRVSGDMNIIFTTIHLRFERIACQMLRFRSPNAYYRLELPALFALDSGNSLRNIYVSSLRTIKQLSGSMTQPNLSQSSGYYSNNYGIETPKNDDFVLNFSANGNIYQSLDFDYGTRVNYTNLTKIYRYVAPGSQAHLSQYPESNYKHIWRNRRVFDDGSNIVSNPRYFFAIEPEDLIAKTYLGFAKDSGSVYWSNFFVDEQALTLTLPYDSVSYQGETAYYYNGKDTLISDWFSVTDDSHLYYRTFSLDTTARMFLQYSDDSSTVELTLPTTFREDSCYYIDYKLKDGLAYNFRLLLIGNDTNKVYYEQEIIGDLPIMDTLNYTIYLDKSIIYSVGNNAVRANKLLLDITPIPAKNVIYVTAQLSERTGDNNYAEIKLKMLSSTGTELKTFTAKSGVRKAIRLEKYPAGVYIIRAEVAGKRPPAAVSKKFIIKR